MQKAPQTTFNDRLISRQKGFSGTKLFVQIKNLKVKRLCRSRT